MNYHATTIKVIEGDIIRYPVEGIILPLDTGGLWLGGVHHAIQYAGVNGALQQVADYWFHIQAARHVHAENNGPVVQYGQAILVDGATYSQKGNFRYVIFVMDNLYYPLADIVASGLKMAYATGMTSVSIPLIRSGVMSVVSSFAIDDLSQEIAQGIRRAIQAYPQQAMQVTVLLDPGANTYWQQHLPQVLLQLDETSEPPFDRKN